MPALIPVWETHLSAALCPGSPHLPNQLAPFVHTDVLLALRPLDADPAAKCIRLHDELSYGEGKEERPLSIGCWLTDCARVTPAPQAVCPSKSDPRDGVQSGLKDQETSSTHPPYLKPPNPGAGKKPGGQAGQGISGLGKG